MFGNKFLGRGFLMFKLGSSQRQEPWMPFIAASVALGLGLYYLYTTQSPPQPSASTPSQVNAQQSCQASDADHQVDAMHREERAYHERFMREAIAMVGLHTSLYLLQTIHV
jgi:tRNA-specific adenosine deaminase 2